MAPPQKQQAKKRNQPVTLTQKQQENVASSSTAINPPKFDVKHDNAIRMTYARNICNIL